MVKNKGNLITIAIIVLIIAFVIYMRFGDSPEPEISEELAKCIADSGAVVYSQIGCIWCEKQKEMFGNNWKYLDEVIKQTDFNRFQEAQITRTPTWIINGQRYEGLQSKASLISITGCEESVE